MFFLFLQDRFSLYGYQKTSENCDTIGTVVQWVQRLPCLTHTHTRMRAYNNVVNWIYLQKENSHKTCPSTKNQLKVFLRIMKEKKISCLIDALPDSPLSLPLAYAYARTCVRQKSPCTNCTKCTFLLLNLTFVMLNLTFCNINLTFIRLTLTLKYITSDLYSRIPVLSLLLRIDTFSHNAETNQGVPDAILIHRLRYIIGNAFHSLGSSSHSYSHPGCTNHGNIVPTIAKSNGF